ncbi:Lysine/ornithine decarboxylase [Thalassovita gelatinovora]|uniref:ornithine decarboxylase n=1 Tax=Thalassovita gelatinovora TaxID=53501 RepID=A0A0P1FDE6_THAGE|nr:type III PLP-dependent enzyme [Thalassovita gelatinovora]CUH66184.1 Lysine/ornithine decarboxylase [Thalassovita gelatinovora]SEQ21453.1 ornithine decarboxylase [Thalassovita gelatinovora]
MNANVTPFACGDAVCAQNRIETFIRSTVFDRPTLVLDRDMVAQQYRALKAGLGRADIHYAVKANPARDVLEVLVSEGSHFDAASRGEIALCLSLGAHPDCISFGNTVKRASDIAFAHQAGITLFAVDAEEELEKIAEHATGAQVYIRLLVGATGADWPLSRKFGCTPEMAEGLMARALELGLTPVGLSFHVGSQTRQAEMWRDTLDQVAAVWTQARAKGYPLSLINIGGGFPAFYGEAIEPATIYAARVMEMVEARFDGAERVMAEPGRGMVAEAGMIAAEVMLVSKKSEDDLHRWVYLDIGKFSGLAETMDEAIRYQFATERDHEDHGPCILAGPSCDSADVLYENRPVMLPVGLRAGDKVIIRSCGAYTSSYSSVGFNGFPPLDVVVI